MSDGLEKMTIEGFKDMSFKSSTNEKISLQINPKEINLDYGIEYNSDETGATGESSRPPGSATYKSPNLEIETYVDATGVLAHIKTEPKLEKPDITEYITQLKKVVYDYIKDTHGPPYVTITWAKVGLASTNSESKNVAMFKGQLTSFKITYELFSKSGNPIRAKINMSFKSMIDPNVRETGQSPDLTHFHDVRMGDNLPALSKMIYGSPDFYLQLAKVNGLSSIYQLKPGMQLVIPPLEKSSR